ncbi:DUF2058 domain-containing protein [Aliidiomarina soli]|uniref:DUF2058 domain-containing protein n=1 Tax=Aliidiomarina soli TaxID=1928574 RepID=A0A432WL75_9GAMM|nr:DUF2058 family protein [Aliidiomarina soli]RUO34566.1 DUF2058 domain-containing protein [Aliidiomarina soli]
MGKSLADQLLGAGLVDDKKLKKVKQEKRKTKKLERSGIAVEKDNTAERVAAERAAKAERDRELNQQRKKAEHAKELRAQAMQMLQQHQQPYAGDIRFNFADPRSSKVHNLMVSSSVQNHLAKGNLAICEGTQGFVVVPRTIADKIAERFAEAVIFIASQDSEQPAEDDPYKDYQVPDDLMW